MFRDLLEMSTSKAWPMRLPARSSAQYPLPTGAPGFQGWLGINRHSFLVIHAHGSGHAGTSSSLSAARNQGLGKRTTRASDVPTWGALRRHCAGSGGVRSAGPARKDLRNSS